MQGTDVRLCETKGPRRGNNRRRAEVPTEIFQMDSILQWPAETSVPCFLINNDRETGGKKTKQFFLLFVTRVREHATTASPGLSESDTGREYKKYDE